MFDKFSLYFRGRKSDIKEEIKNKKEKIIRTQRKIKKKKEKIIRTHKKEERKKEIIEIKNKK